jgi:hypothetical protein
MKNTQRVWYASYGSNLRRQRFMCYIQGGVPEGRTEPNEGSRDKTPPSDSRPVPLNFDLYFAGSSAAWGNGGTAFIRRGSRSSIALGRMYLITDEQFNDVVLQENAKKVDGTRFVPPFAELARKQKWVLPGNPLYGGLLNIGSEGGYPVLTFTTARTDLQVNAPHENYVKTIASGIKETYPRMSNAEISKYLLGAEGIRGNIDPSQIDRWVREV